ncbi:MAG: biotin transporter BioY [Treponema sp.]|nr:biotin transporter BioY [Treponema sp.]
MKKNTLTKKATVTALFAALVCAGCFIQIPIPGGIPVTIQDMMAMLCGLLLGPLYGGLAVLMFLILGCFGLPVFTGKAGLSVILNGPTGGFLIGYLCAAVISGLIIQLLVKEESRPLTEQDEKSCCSSDSRILRLRNNLNWLFIALAAISATIIVFVLGIVGFHRVKPDLEMSKVLAAVLIPFIPGNTLKIIIMIPLVKRLRPAIKNYLC